MDIVEPEISSRMMAGMKVRHTKPEIVVHEALHAIVFRIGLHDKRLPMVAPTIWTVRLRSSANAVDRAGLDRNHYGVACE